jgi:hypothetical protein
MKTLDAQTEANYLSLRFILSKIKQLRKARQNELEFKELGAVHEPQILEIGIKEMPKEAPVNVAKLMQESLETAQKLQIPLFKPKFEIHLRNGVSFFIKKKPKAKFIGKWIDGILTWIEL